MAERETIFLIDASAIMFRSFYGLAPLRTNSGIPTQATYGFFKAIKKLLDKFNPSKILIAWDSQKSVRREKEPSYKAKRLSFPDELAIQRQYIIKIAQTMHFAQLELAGFEADDIIATAARKYSDYQICIVSSDKDLLQLVDPRVKQFDPAKDKLIDSEEVVKTYGFGPEKINFYHSLLGDSTDNIPGAKGIGKKTATELVLQFKNLDDLYSNLNLVEKDRTRKLLEESRDQVFLSKELFDLIDCQIDFKPEELVFDHQNWSLAGDIFRELEFKSFIADKPSQNQLSILGEQKSEEKSFDWLKFSVISQKNELEALILKAKESKIISFDLETTGFNFRYDKIVGISLAYDSSEAFYIPVGHQKTPTAQLDLKTVFDLLSQVLADVDVVKVLQNAKFDIHFLNFAGIKIKGQIFDTMIAARLVRPEWQKVDLSTLAKDYLGLVVPSYKELFADFEDFSAVPLDLAAPYGASDAMVTFKLHKILVDLLQSESTEMPNLFETIEMPILPVLIEMEESGIALSSDVLNSMNIEISKKLSSLEAKIRATLESFGVKNWAEVNLLSPKQVEKVLFDDIKLTPITKHRGGARSTSKDVLEDLAKVHPVPGMIFQYRKLSKLQKTYLEALPLEVDQKSGKIYTTFWQTRAATGRLVSSDPNLQNIPNLVREAFVAREDSSFIAIDYSQIELRVLAHLSEDQNLIKAFQDNLDIHSQTAGKIFGRDPKNIAPEERKVGKRINFSVIYGLSAFSLARELEISRGKAQEYIDAFFDQYPGVARWMSSVIDEAKKSGFVTTLMGRKRFVPGINDKNRIVGQAAQRVAVNTVVQGTAADIIKMAMIRLFDELKIYGSEAKIVLQVHDELLIEVCDRYSSEVVELAKNVMSKIVKLAVNLDVTVKTGKTWGDVSK